MPIDPRITAIYRACDPKKPLEADDERYVPLAEARGQDLAEKGGCRYRLKRTILESSDSTVSIVSGFLGDGKTTELKQLEKELNDSKIACVFVDCEQYVNPDAYSFIDILLAIIGETGKQLKEKYRVDLNPSYLQKRMAELSALMLSRFDLENPKVGVKAKPPGPFEISAELAMKTKTEASVRRKVWEALEGDNATLSETFGSLLLTDAKPKLKKKGYSDLVIIVDWLEKLSCLKGEKEGMPNKHVEVFIHNAPQFLKLGAHLVLTCPIDLVYSAEQARMSNAFGREQEVISAVRVDRYFSKPEREKAFDALIAMLTKRFEKAEGYSTPFSNVIPTREFAEEIIEFSGGHPRQLLILIQECLQAIETLPITRDAFQIARRREIRSAGHRVPTSWFPLLAKVNATKKIDVNAVHLEMLRTLCVFAYQNTETVYAVDPAILQLKQMQEAMVAHAKPA